MPYHWRFFLSTKKPTLQGVGFQSTTNNLNLSSFYRYKPISISWAEVLFLNMV